MTAKQNIQAKKSICWENLDLLVGSNPLPGSYINFVDLTNLPQICMGDKILKDVNGRKLIIVKFEKQ